MLRFHPSSVGLLMSDAQSIDRALVPAELLHIFDKPRKSDADREALAPYKEMSLSAGAKTHLRQLAKEYVYGYRKVVENKYLDKGLAMESEAIAFINRVRFKRYEKNTERRKNDFLTGECDIYVPGVKTIDTKCSWDLSTFPAFEEDAHDSLYEWQGRAYMSLWDVPEHEVVYVMLDTPDDLLKPWERDSNDVLALHRVGHIEQDLRLTSITYQRCPIMEAKLERKCRQAQAYLQALVDRIKAQHGIIEHDEEPAAPAAPATDWRTEFLQQA